MNSSAKKKSVVIFGALVLLIFNQFLLPRVWLAASSDAISIISHGILGVAVLTNVYIDLRVLGEDANQDQQKRKEYTVFLALATAFFILYIGFQIWHLIRA